MKGLMGLPESAKKRCGLDEHFRLCQAKTTSPAGDTPAVKGGPSVGSATSRESRDNSPPINALSDEEKSRILGNFAQKMIDGSQDIDPDIAAAVGDNFWDLI